MGNRRKDDAGHDDDSEATVQRIKTREEFAPERHRMVTGPIPPRSIDALRNASIQPSFSKM